MNVTPFNIPRVVYLPGVKIKVRRGKLKNSYGTWNDETGTITIDNRQPIETQRYVLLHELAHALQDYQHACYIDYVADAPKENHERRE